MKRLVCSLAALTLLSTPAAPTAAQEAPPPAASGNRPSTEARLAKRLAVEAGRRGQWQAAFARITEAVAASPGWGEAYYLRAAISVELAGADVSAGAVTGLQREAAAYRKGEKLLRHAAADYAKYLELTPGAADAAIVRVAIAVYEARAAEVAEAEGEVERREQARIAAIVGPRRTAGWVFLGVGLASGVAAAVFAGLGAAQNDFIREGHFFTGNDIAGAAELGNTLNLLTYAFGIGAASLTGAGVPLLLSTLGPPPAAAPVALRVGPSGVFLVGEF